MSASGNIPTRAPAGPLPEEAVRRLAPYADERALRALRVRTGRPWAWLPVLLRAGAVTLGTNVLFRDGRYRPDSAAGLALVAHEAIHVRQYRERGAPRFLARYLVGALRTGFAHAAHPLEQEPRAVQERVREELTRGGL